MILKIIKHIGISNELTYNIIYGAVKMKASELFKDKYQNKIVRDVLIDLVEQMTELKRKNYHDMLEVDKRKDKIREIEGALTELGIPFKIDWNPNDDDIEDDYE